MTSFQRNFTAIAEVSFQDKDKLEGGQRISVFICPGEFSIFYLVLKFFLRQNKIIKNFLKILYHRGLLLLLAK